MYLDTCLCQEKAKNNTAIVFATTVQKTTTLLKPGRDRHAALQLMLSVMQLLKNPVSRDSHWTAHLHCPPILVKP